MPYYYYLLLSTKSTIIVKQVLLLKRLYNVAAYNLTLEYNLLTYLCLMGID